MSAFTGKEHRRVIVTGASRGLGRVMAGFLARSGWQVGVVSRDEEALADLVRGSQGIFAETADLTDAGATRVAIDVLRAGGSAVDAAIAANAMLCVCEPTGCGIGGDLFAIVWDGDQKKLHGLNASGRSPAALPRAGFVDNGYEAIPKYGPLPISVPGCVDGWVELHKRFGKLTMRSVLRAAIEAAEAGAETLVLERGWRGGGTSAESTGQIYLGGGTPRAGRRRQEAPPRRSGLPPG